MSEGKVSICVKAPAQPSDCFRIGVELQLGAADPGHPYESKSVARRKTERLFNVTLSFAGTTKKIFGEADETVGESRISIQ